MIPLILVGVIHFSRLIITPNDLFFELSIGEIPQIEKDKWRLSIVGQVENEIVFDYNNFTSLKSKSLIFKELSKKKRSRTKNNLYEKNN